MSVSAVPASGVSGRHARMLRILHQLQSGCGLNADALADQLKVSRRTIFRDLRTMREAGVEVYFDELADRYRLTPQEGLIATPALETEELTALLAAAQLSVLSQHKTLQRSIDKLLASSPRATQYLAQRVVQSCCLVSQRPSCSSQTAQKVHLVLRAIAQRRMLHVTLFDTELGAKLETQLAPYQMLSNIDDWQVTGRSSHHRAVGTYDLCHITQPTMTDQIYAIPRSYQTVA